MALAWRDLPALHGIEQAHADSQSGEDHDYPMAEHFDDDLYVDSNGCPTERVSLGGREVIVHYDDIPAKDKTTVGGIPCTTALRTVIEIAPDVDPAKRERIVQDCIDRRLFTVDEARARLAEQDMLERPGADLLRGLLPR